MPITMTNTTRVEMNFYPSERPIFNTMTLTISYPKVSQPNDDDPDHDWNECAKYTPAFDTPADELAEILRQMVGQLQTGLATALPELLARMQNDVNDGLPNPCLTDEMEVPF